MHRPPAPSCSRPLPYKQELERCYSEIISTDERSRPDLYPMTASGTPLPYDATAPSPRLAQELLNYILDYVEDYASLRSCSLAASCLRSYAQERLFTSIQVDATTTGNNIHALHNTLSSTSLATHVRRVKVIGQTYLINFTDVSLLQDVLQLLASGGHTEAERHEMTRGPTNSITHLRFEQVGLNDRQLLDIISHFPRLSALEVISSFVSQEPAEVADHPESPPPNLRDAPFVPPLTSLSFRESNLPESLLRALTNSQNAKLQSVNFVMAEAPPIACQALVESAWESLEYLSVVPGVFDSAWPLSENHLTSFERHTALRALTVGYPDLLGMGINRWLLALVQTLRSIVSCLESFSIQFALVTHDEDPTDAFATLDKLLSEGPQFTRLRRVDIHARVRTTNTAQHMVVDDSTPQKIAKLSVWLPRLVQRGILYCEGEQVVPPAQPE